MESEGIIRKFGFTSLSAAKIPPGYEDLGLLLSEKRVRLPEAGLSQDEIEEAERVRSSLPPEPAAVFIEIEEFFIRNLITFPSRNSSGADRYRVLQADPDCVLNFWGCMRSTTGWLMPATPGRAG